MSVAPLFTIRLMTPADVPAAVEMQKSAFPPPFSEELHWDPQHLLRHISVFPDGQFVAEVDGKIVGSCSNAVISEEKWLAHGSWGATVGGPYIRFHRNDGSSLYGLDITVHPEFRRIGVGRAFYARRFEIVKSRNLQRYGTGCRMPDYREYASEHPLTTVSDFAAKVAAGETVDRTLTPLLRYGLALVGVIENYMEDVESANTAALLEWVP